MSKIRMNTEYRNKLYNRIKDVFEKEDTQERQAFMESREQFNEMQNGQITFQWLSASHRHYWMHYTCVFTGYGAKK